MLLVFVGQTVAMPLLSCCVETENMTPASLAMSSQHALNETEMSDHHHSDMPSNKHAHAVEANCDHQCDLCLGSVLVEEFAAFTPQSASTQLNEIYYFHLPVSSKDNPFRPPIFT